MLSTPALYLVRSFLFSGPILRPMMLTTLILHIDHAQNC
jgi:hypothetical protein